MPATHAESQSQTKFAIPSNRLEKALHQGWYYLFMAILCFVLNSCTIPGRNEETEDDFFEKYKLHFDSFYVSDHQDWNDFALAICPPNFKPYQEDSVVDWGEVSMALIDQDCVDMISAVSISRINPEDPNQRIEISIDSTDIETLREAIKSNDYSLLPMLQAGDSIFVVLVIPRDPTEYWSDIQQAMQQEPGHAAQRSVMVPA